MIRWHMTDKDFVQVLDRSIAHYLRGTACTSVGAFTCVTAWIPVERWKRAVSVSWPRWLLLEMNVHDLEWWLMSVLKKLSDKDRAGIPEPQFTDAEFIAQFPGLAEHLAACRFPDGAARQTSTLLLFVADGAWRACLRDRENAICLWASATALDELLDSLETMVQNPDAVWRQDKASGAPTAARVNPAKRAGRKPGK